MPVQSKPIRRALMLARVGKADGGDVSDSGDVMSAVKEGFGDRPLGLPDDVKQRLETDGPVGIINRDVIDPAVAAGDAVVRSANAGIYGAGRIARRAYESLAPHLPDAITRNLGSGQQLEDSVRDMPNAFMADPAGLPKDAAQTAVNIAKQVPTEANQRGMIHLGDGPERFPAIPAAPEPNYFSALERGIADAKQAKASPQEWKAIASKFPKEEADYRGLHDFLDAQNGSITKDQVLKHLAENPVQVNEVWKDGSGDNPTKFYDHVMLGGDNYKEMLLTLPDRSAANELATYLTSEPSLIREIKSADDLNTAQAHNPYLREAIKGLSINDAWKEIQNLQSGRSKTSPAFQSPHFSEPNILAHVRMNDRTGPNGENLLHLEEIQSDWHQKGKEQGYAVKSNRPITDIDKDMNAVTSRLVDREPDTHNDPHGAWERQPDLLNEYNQLQAERNSVNGSAVPDAPFKDTKDWTALAMKRAMRYAADNGYDGLTWTTGAQQADRYDLSKHVSEIHYDPVFAPDGKTLRAGDLKAYDGDGDEVINEESVTPGRLADMIGKDAAKRIIESPTHQNGTTRVLAGDDLRVGAKGMQTYYDSIVPSVANKIGKPYGAQVGKTSFRTSDGPGWVIQRPDGKFYPDEYKDQKDATTVLRQRGMSAPHLGFKVMQKPGRDESVHYLPIPKAMKGKAHKMFRRGGRVDDSPTEAQKEAGNYKKEHVRWHGLDISIENKKGSTRSGKDANGKAWSCTLPADYGYIKRTEGADGDHVDVYLGPNRTSHQVFIVNQIDHKTGKFDEHKVMLGYESERAAVADYCRAFSDGKGMARLRSVEPVSIDAFKRWLKSGDTQKPAASRNIVEHALKLISTTGPYRSAKRHV